MWRRAKAACSGEISQVTIRPPGAEAGGHGQGRVAAERPDLEDRGGRQGEGQHLEVPALQAAHHHVGGLSSVTTSSAASASRWSGGAVVCAVA